MEIKDKIIIEGMGNEDSVRHSVLSRMARMISRQLSQKGSMEKLDIRKDGNKVKLRLLFNEEVTESEGEDENLFFAFGKAQQNLFKKLGISPSALHNKSP